MAVSDALVVGEDWISEHYFTTDATKESFLARVLERRKEWEALEKPADPGTAPTPTPRSRFRSERSRLEELLAVLPEGSRAALLGVLAEDPRPAYQNDPERVYGFGFAGAEVRFRVEGERLFVLSVTKN